MSSSNMYCITIKFTNPSYEDFLYTNAPTAIEALHVLQTTLDTPTLKRIKNVVMEIYNPFTKQFELMGNYRTCDAWVNYVHTL